MKYSSGNDPHIQTLRRLLADVLQGDFCQVPKNYLLEVAGHGNFCRAMKRTLSKVLPDDVGYKVSGDMVYFVRFDALTFPTHLFPRKQ